jgi:hypothetical protein
MTDDNNNKPSHNRIMMGLSLLLAVSNHNMWSYYDWVYCCFRLLVNTICGRIMIGLLTDNNNNKSNHNATRYCVYLRTTTTINRIINTICGRIMIGLLLLSSVSKHFMWSYYDWVYCCCRPSVNTICGRIIRPHIVFIDGQQQRQPNHNTTTYCVYWRKTTTTQS